MASTPQSYTHPLFQPVLSREAMRKADQTTIDSFGIPAFTLMESAGRAAVSILESHIGNLEGKTFLCVCGKGNNGGDGYVVARVLASRGAFVHVLSIGEPESLSTESAQNFQLLRTLLDKDPSSHLTLHSYEALQILDELPDSDAIIDGLLGTGIERSLRPPYLEIVKWINRQKAFTLSLDLPSGMHANRGIPLGDAIQADATVAIGAYKTGHFLGKGMLHSGHIDVVEIGIPRYLLSAGAKEEHSALVPTTDLIKSWLPDRSIFDHKYSVGMALIVAGSKGLTGAATLASWSAEQAGAGAVVCATPEEVQSILASKMTEVMTFGLPTTKTGIDPEKSLQKLQPSLDKASALLVGCGMGRATDSQRFIRNLLQNTLLPVVLDADGLNAFQGHVHHLPELSKGNWILTPHLGEFKRLMDEDENLENRLETVRKYALRWNCVLILKGTPSLVGDPEGHVYINPMANGALATAGTGDVLAGLCVGLLAQGLSPVQAALSALHIGSSAAAHYVHGQRSSTMLASDLIHSIRTVLFERYTS